MKGTASKRKETSTKGRGQRQREGESSNEMGTAAAPQRLHSLTYTFMYISKRSFECGSALASVLEVQVSDPRTFRCSGVALLPVFMLQLLVYIP